MKTKNIHLPPIRISMIIRVCCRLIHSIWLIFLWNYFIVSRILIFLFSCLCRYCLWHGLIIADATNWKKFLPIFLVTFWVRRFLRNPFFAALPWTSFIIKSWWIRHPSPLILKLVVIIILKWRCAHNFFFLRGLINRILNLLALLNLIIILRVVYWLSS